MNHDAVMLSVCPLFAQGAVLQRGKPITVWGQGLPAAAVTVSIDGNSVSGVVGVDGEWQIGLPSHPAGGPYTLIVESRGNRIEIVDVLYGDVWVLGGQSNMQLWMSRVAYRFPDELEAADDRAVRFYIVPEACRFRKPVNRMGASRWLVEGEDDLSGVSAAGFFFAKHLRQWADVPIGFLQTALGGTPIDSWIGEEWLERLGLLPDDSQKWRDEEYVRRLIANNEADLARFVADADALDCGLREQWQRVELDDGDWSQIVLADAGSAVPELSSPGIVWFRATIQVPEELVGCPGHMRFGTLTDADWCYVNGELIGQTGYRYPPRNYDIAVMPASLTLVFRLRVNTHLGGGFMKGKRREILVDTPQGLRRLDLDAAGLWRFRRSCSIPSSPEQFFPSRVPAACYNAMIAPLGRYGVAGVLWYQGESNANRTPLRYTDKMLALIQCWRRTFGEPDLPFIYAQLPGIAFEAKGWAKIRDEQRRALALDGTAMITLLDCGEFNDLHPLNKDIVGKRFALAAASLVYGVDCEFMGPLIAGVTRGEGSLTLRFTHCVGGLTLMPGRMRDDLVFELFDPLSGGGMAQVVHGVVASPSTVRIDLPCDMVIGAEARLRYAWADCPDPVLCNGVGLPAAAFELEIGC
ncbi:sialate O-acetylesterase [Bifidobacterium sp. UBA744]|uniref:sialate O-acetylesterase n=1 Tax=Bifidobacterium sp. UBA744 TaxID=1946112 RepID=UPI0025BF2E92|nr:sialate O-acetylesterase [Bifidobacterium sp. UBA744]